jgi:hypothetical protein
MKFRLLSAPIFLLLITFSSVFGQTKNLILTREQNSKWLDSVKTLELEQQLITIKQRLLSDTNVFVKQYYNDRIRVVDQLGNRVYGDGKPTIIISGYVMFIDNKTSAKKIIKLAEILNTTHIKMTTILNDKDPATTALYGSSGLSGIIIMTVTKKKYLKKFRQLKLKPTYSLESTAYNRRFGNMTGE